MKLGVKDSATRTFGLSIDEDGDVVLADDEMNIAYLTVKNGRIEMHLFSGLDTDVYATDPHLSVIKVVK